MYHVTGHVTSLPWYFLPLPAASVPTEPDVVDHPDMPAAFACSRHALPPVFVAAQCSAEPRIEC